MYEYKVDSLEAKVSEADLKKGQGGAKVVAQVETKLADWAKNGWQLHSQNFVNVTVAPGCFSRLTGAKDFTVPIMILVFYRQVS